MMTEGPAQLVVENATVLLDEGGIRYLDGATIVVRDGLIAEVSSDIVPGSVAAIERIDAAGQVAMPGFINCHSHSPMVLFRGAAEDVPLERWFNDIIWPMEVNLTAEDVEAGALLAAAESIQAGVTTFADHYFHMPAVARAVATSGLRANLGSTFFSGDEAALDRSLEFALEFDGAADGRITTSLAPHAPYTVTDADLARTAAAAAEHDLLVHIHAAETRRQTNHSRDARGLTPIQILERSGMLEGRTLIAHGIGIVPEDMPILAAAAARTGVATGPRGYLKDSADTTPVRMLAAWGIAVGLGTDGAATNNTLDVWEEMTYLTLVQKAFEDDSTYMTAEDALRIAFRGSARALGMADTIGALAPGRAADLILVDLQTARAQPVHDLSATIVQSARSSDVTTTIVAGRVLMRDKKLTTIDLPALLDDIRPRLARLTDTAHGTRIQEYRA